MATQTETVAETRTPLTRDRVLRAAVDLADESGIESLTMRNLGEALGVKAMSLYNHVTNKDDILNAVIDLVMSEIDQAASTIGGPSPQDDWKTAVRQRILASRQILLRHPWAPRVIETRAAMSLPMVKYFDGLLGLMREGGFSYDLAHHALHVLGSRALGFTQEMFDEESDAAQEESQAMLEQMAEHVPYIVEMMAEITHGEPESTLGWCDDQFEFEFGLDLILDGLDRVRARG